MPGAVGLKEQKSILKDPQIKEFLLSSNTKRKQNDF